MAALNREASRLMVEAGAHAATDVTGFGLAGHGLGMARASGISLRVSLARLPVYEHALDMLRAGVKTRGTTANQAAYAASVVAAPATGDDAALVYDPQTSGGLLIAVEAARAEPLAAALRARGAAAATVIGEAIPADGGESRLEVVA
jgi:selenide,water dikinase